MTLILVSPAKADTTGNINTGTNTTGTIGTTGNFQIVIDPVTKIISILGNTGTITT